MRQSERALRFLKGLPQLITLEKWHCARSQDVWALTDWRWDVKRVASSLWASVSSSGKCWVKFQQANPVVMITNSGWVCQSHALLSFLAGGQSPNPHLSSLPRSARELPFQNILC